MARATAVALVLILAACAPGDGLRDGDPMIDRIDDAVFALETFYGAPQDYFEIAAFPDQVSLITAVDDATRAEQAYWTVDDGLVEPVDVGEASGFTFQASDIDVFPDRVLDNIRDELDDPTIADFAVQGVDGGRVRYDATVVSDEGGTLRVVLARDGEILGVEAS